jgi:nitrogen fixation protein FixH
MIMVMVVFVALVAAMAIVMIVWHDETWIDDVLVDKRRLVTSPSMRQTVDNKRSSTRIRSSV